MKLEEKILTVLEQIRDKLSPQPITIMPILYSKDGRFIRNSDGTVIDKQLELIWYPTLDKKFTWEEAKKECEKIGCRLPTTHELFSLVDHTKYSPATDKDIFPDTKTDDWYWTSTACAWYSSGAWCVGFYIGGVFNSNKGYTDYVRPVRSSQ